MSSPIDFYFDFSSPYGYFASCLIDDLAAKHDRKVNWRPFLLGAVLKTTGRQPLVNIPLVRDYAAIDLPRSARFYNIPLNWPEKFPIASVAACRVYYWLLEHDAVKAKELAKIIYRAYFVDGRDISKASEIADIATEQGQDRDEIENALKDPVIKNRLRQATDEAIERKVFGSPYMIADNEPFWGVDRLDQLDRWLTTGGW